MDEPTNGSKPLSGAEKKLRNLRPFKPGPDPRRHTGGRPKSFDYARELAQAIAEEKIQLKNGKKVTIAEVVLRSWVNSPEPSLQRAFVEYAFGKVPDKIEATGLENKTVLALHFDHENGVTRG